MSDPNDRENVPPGWDYNPASWSQRGPIIVLALVGVGIATYLALWQYRVVEDVWEPFFGDGTEKILDTELSWVLPLGISDAALGAFAYLLDAVTGAIGGRNRWRTMPWIVIVFAILVGPLGLVSIGLTIAQPVLYSEWCTLCLASAVVSVLMIGPAMDEALASLQFMMRIRRETGRSWWRVFWGLGDQSRVVPVSQAREPQPVPRRYLERWNLPLNQMAVWAQGVAALVGIWIMAAPGLFDFTDVVRTHDRVVGPFIAAFACIAMWEATRPLRWINAVLGVWLLIAPWLLSFEPQATVNSMAVGVLVIILSSIKGRMKHHFAGGWSALWRSERNEVYLHG